jgi:predicted dehydrogenase
MCQAAQARDLVFGVFENFRQAPATRQLRWAFESGVCGQLQMILLGYAGVWWAPNRIVAGTPWRHYKNEGGGISLDLGVHFFDQIRHVAGEIKTVQAQTCVLEPQRVTIDEHGRQVAKIDCDADDTFFAQIETEQGVVGNLFASWAGHGAPTKAGQGVVYYSTSGRVTGDEVDLDDGLPPRRLGEMFAVHAAEEDRHRLFPLGLTDSFALNHYDWLQAIRQRRPPETSGEEGLRDLAAAFAILESSLAGRKVEVAEVLDGSRRDYQRPIDAALGLE